MKIVILTSDIIDGLIISEKILLSGKDVKAVFYERKKLTLKSRAKRLFYKISGKLNNISYEGLRKYGKIDIFPVMNMNTSLVREALGKIKPDLNIVIGTRKLSKEIFDSSRLGAINMHSGILPFYRGADSEFWALSNGEKEKIGVTIHFIDEDLDTGDIILTARQNVLDSDDHKTLRMKNIFLGAEKIIEALDLIERGDYVRQPQDKNQAKTYKSATAEDIARYRKDKK